MKKLSVFIIILLISFVGCDFLGLFFTLSPPSWILGSWADEYDINTWAFSSDNVVYSAEFVSFDFKELIRDGNITATDTSTSTKYTLSIDESGTSSSYIFEKLSATTLNYSIRSSGVVLGPFVLIKQ